MQTKLRVIGTILALLFFATDAQAGMTGGQFALDGKAFSPREVSAFHTQRWADKGKYLTMVLLTANEINKAKIGSAPFAYDTAINDPSVKGSDYIVVWVEPNGQVNINATIAGQQFVDTTGEMAGQPGNLTANCPTNKPEVVTCQVKTKHEVKTLSGHTYTLDVIFDDKVISK